MKGSTSSQLNAIIVINIIVILLGFFFGLIGHGPLDGGRNRAGQPCALGVYS